MYVEDSADACQQLRILQHPGARLTQLPGVETTGGNTHLATQGTNAVTELALVYEAEFLCRSSAWKRRHFLGCRSPLPARRHGVSGV